MQVSCTACGHRLNDNDYWSDPRKCDVHPGVIAKCRVKYDCPRCKSSVSWYSLDLPPCADCVREREHEAAVMRRVDAGEECTLSINDTCYTSYPCKHRVRFVFGDGAQAVQLMGMRQIEALYAERGIVLSDVHDVSAFPLEDTDDEEEYARVWGTRWL